VYIHSEKMRKLAEKREELKKKEVSNSQHVDKDKLK
jgi:hypothetical protein